MSARDPETGQFVAQSDRYDDIEVATFAAHLGVEAANLGGGTGFTGGTSDSFEGVELIDYDDIVDRNEELELLAAAHRLTVYANSTETADGTVLANVEISAAPSRSLVAGPSVAESFQDDVVGQARSDDSIDFIGRPLSATGHAPFSDGATGVGGGGSAGEDMVVAHAFPTEFGAFHPRDELFMNGTFTVWNIDDAGVHLDLHGQHVYGVRSA